MHDVVMMQLFRSHQIAESQPQTVQQVHFVCGEVRRVRSKNFIDLVAVRQMHFKIELRLGIRKFFPGFADLPRLLFALPSTRGSHYDGGGLQAVPGA